MTEGHGVWEVVRNGVVHDQRHGFGYVSRDHGEWWVWYVALGNGVVLDFGSRGFGS